MQNNRCGWRRGFVSGSKTGYDAMASYQQVGDKVLKRVDHVWFSRDNGTYKCCLCGAVCTKPPKAPTKENWDPMRYEPLNDVERAMCPFEQRGSS